MRYVSEGLAGAWMSRGFTSLPLPLLRHYSLQSTTQLPIYTASSLKASAQSLSLLPMQSSLVKATARPGGAAAASSPVATGSPSSGPFSRCHAFASILRSAGIPPERAFSDLGVCSLANQIIPEVSRPMLSLLMQNPHTSMPVQVYSQYPLNWSQSHLIRLHCLLAAMSLCAMLMCSQQLLSIFSVPDFSDLKDTLQQLQLLGIVTSTAGSGSSSSGSDGDSSFSVRISHVFHTSLSTFRSELPPPPSAPYAAFPLRHRLILPRGTSR